MTQPLSRHVLRITRQLRRQNPFEGDCIPTRVPIFSSRSGRPSVPFPHPWNYREPIQILETYFWDADREQGSGRHNRYLDFPGFAPVLVTRDPGVIRAILTATGDQKGQFDRDTLPSSGIARATGRDTLLFSNGPFWRKQRMASASPFGKTSLFHAELFEEFAITFRNSVQQRLAVLNEHLQRLGTSQLEIAIEPEIKTLMLEMLVNCFFGASVSYDRLRNYDVPALERIIEHIIHDTVSNRLGLPIEVLSRMSPRYARMKADYEQFDDLTNLVLSSRQSGRGLWKKFQSDVPDEALRSNIKVFLAGALEATTSYTTWAISHLARHADIQEKIHEEVRDLTDYSPEHLDRCPWLMRSLDETLRLTPALYFLPRRATSDTWIETADGRRMRIPDGTHILLDIWHANRHEDHWGVPASGFPAGQFAPQRWEVLKQRGTPSKDMLHFGFGHGARVCPGKHLAQLEVALCVGAFVKLFQFHAPRIENPERAGVSTKPRDGTVVVLQRRS